MGARARVCPACGRGSLFGELGLIAVLGILLLGIALASGLVPLGGVQRGAGVSAPDSGRSAAPSHRLSEPGAAQQRARGARRGRAATATVAGAGADTQATAAPMDRTVGYAPCALPETAPGARFVTAIDSPDTHRAAEPTCGPASTPDTTPPANPAPHPSDSDSAGLSPATESPPSY